jgi:DNA-binding transcriptional MerR regulator
MLIERKRIPDKIYYSISEVSRYTEVEPHVLRYWETKFSKLKPKRVGGNQRKYTRNDLELLFVIKDLLYNEGFTLDGAEKKLKEGYGKTNSRNGGNHTVSSVLESVPAEPPAPPPVAVPVPPAPAPAPVRGATQSVPANNRELQEIKKELKAILKLLS